MRNPRIEHRIYPLASPFDITNPNHSFKPDFNFFQSYNGLVSRSQLKVKGDTPRYQYFLCIHNPEKVVKGNYIIILKKINGKENEIYSLETPIEVKRYSIAKKESLTDKPLGNIKSCRFYIGSDCNIRCGKYLLFLYKQVHEPKTLISYLYNDKKMSGVYITLAPIRKTINRHKGDMIDHVTRITFKKNQLVPIGDKYIIIIDNEPDFMKWVDNKITVSTVTQTDFDSNDRIRQAIKTYLAKETSILNQLHPSYIEQICDSLVTTIHTELTTNFFDLYITDYIRKHVLNISKPQFNQIMNERSKKYGKIFTEKGLNTEKIDILFKEYNLDAEYLTKIIKDNYHWFVINEAIDTIKKQPNFQELKQTVGKITNEVYILFRKILAFETKYYKEEKDVNKV